MEKLTLAEVKRRCTVGVRLTMTFHAHPKLWRTAKLRTQILAGAYTRPIIKAQGNAIVLAHDLEDGRPGGSWLYWPKAKDYRADGPDTFTILEDGAAVMSYRIEPSVEAPTPAVKWPTDEAATELGYKLLGVEVKGGEPRYIDSGIRFSTPRPWTVVDESDDDGDYVVLCGAPGSDGDNPPGAEIAQFCNDTGTRAQHLADANLIVKSVNAFELLTGSVEELATTVQDLLNGYPPDQLVRLPAALLEHARAALEAAGTSGDTLAQVFPTTTVSVPAQTVTTPASRLGGQPTPRPWKRYGPELTDAIGRRLAWLGFAKERGASMKLTAEEADANQDFILKAVETYDAIEAILNKRDESSDRTSDEAVERDLAVLDAIMELFQPAELRSKGGA